MSNNQHNFSPELPTVNFEDLGMFSEFATEALNLLMEAKNSVFSLEAVPNDNETIYKVYKIFHALRGLSAFLNLRDIRLLSEESEKMFDYLRKGFVPFEGDMIETAHQCINGLTTLLDLLSEQISNGGKMEKPYQDIGPVLSRVQRVNQSLARPKDEDEPPREHQRVPIPVDDNRAKIMKRQQELIKERELAIKLSQQAQQLAAAKSELLAHMSHEIRTLINAILGFSDLLDRTELDDKQKDYLNPIIMSSKLLLDIINNILDLEKVERGKLSLESIDFDLEALVEDVFKIMRSRLEGKRIVLYFDIDERIPRHLNGDPTRLRQILINLLSNAVKFTEKGEVGLTINLEEDLSLKASGSWATLSFVVQDTGAGIPKSQQSFIFESFTQADRTISRQYGGTGLGLSISKSYIEAMGGNIRVESDVGKGSRFLFTIEFSTAKDEPVRSSVKPLSVDCRGKRIVVFDKEARGALKKLCGQFGCEITLLTGTYKDVFDQLISLHEEKRPLPDALFVDVLMSQEEGYLLASKIRQEERLRAIKLVAVTSDIKIGVTSPAYRECFDDYILRPIIRSELINLLKRVLGVAMTGAGPKAVAANAKASCVGVKVLIVDDSVTNLELIKAYFETIGCAGDFVVNGQEAIEKARQTRYDICFMDLQMPVMNGYAAAQIIREDIDKDIPIIALTAADVDEDREKCFQIGFNDFLSKPFNMDDFQNKIIQYARR